MIIGLIVLLPIYNYLISTHFSSGEMVFFYVRRFLIRPMFLLILVPCFYYPEIQHKKTSQNKFRPFFIFYFDFEKYLPKILFFLLQTSVFLPLSFKVIPVNLLLRTENNKYEFKSIFPSLLLLKYSLNYIIRVSL